MIGWRPGISLDLQRHHPGLGSGGRRRRPARLGLGARPGLHDARGNPRSETVFRIRIFDENCELRFVAHHGNEKDEHGWHVIPSTLPSAAIRVYPGAPDIIPDRRLS
jgi:hypothetical protein